MNAGSRRHWPERVVHSDIDIVSLTPGSDLARLGKPAGDAHVNARIVDQVAVDQLAEFPLAAELFTGRQRHPGSLA